MMINRKNFLWVNKYLEWLLEDRHRNIETVDRYKFWLRHLLLWAMDIPFPEAHKIKLHFSKYIERMDKPLAPESPEKNYRDRPCIFQVGKNALFPGVSGTSRLLD